MDASLLVIHSHYIMHAATEPNIKPVGESLLLCERLTFELIYVVLCLSSLSLVLT